MPSGTKVFVTFPLGSRFIFVVSEALIAIIQILSRRVFIGNTRNGNCFIGGAKEKPERRDCARAVYFCFRGHFRAQQHSFRPIQGASAHQGPCCTWRYPLDASFVFRRHSVQFLIVSIILRQFWEPFYSGLFVYSTLPLPPQGAGPIVKDCWSGYYNDYCCYNAYCHATWLMWVR